MLLLYCCRKCRIENEASYFKNRRFPFGGTISICLEVSSTIARKPFLLAANSGVFVRPQLLTITQFQFEKPTQDSFSTSRPSNALKKTMIVCEDDPDLLRVYTLALRSKYEVIVARSGQECIQKYSQRKHSGGKIDIVLLDYRLSDTTGDDVAIKVKELDGSKVILISAYEIDTQLLNALKKNGFISMFLKKPITIKELWVALEEVLST
jgi:CheY-like chemotaxis protein